MSVRERANRKDSRGKTAAQLRRAFPWIYEPAAHPAAAALPWPPIGQLAGTRLTGRGYLRAVDALVACDPRPTEAEFDAWWITSVAPAIATVTDGIMPISTGNGR